MEKLPIFCLVFLLPIFTGEAQKFGYVDSQIVLERMPAYAEVQQEIETLTSNWLKEIEAMKKKIGNLQSAYATEEVLMTPEMRKERQKEIQTQETALRAFQNNAFGYQGLLYLKRQELIKPLQDEIGEAAQRMARKKRLQFIFDKSADIVMIYANPKHNYTDFLLEELGLGDPADTVR